MLRVFLKQLYFLEFKAVSDQVFELLSSWKLSGNDKGTAVLSLDPEEGPYSDIQFEAIRRGLDNKYAESVIDDEEYSLAQLFAATGRRPIQIASLKIGDFHLKRGGEDYLLMKNHKNSVHSLLYSFNKSLQKPFFCE